jgi:hypothetical protein
MGFLIFVWQVSPFLGCCAEAESRNGKTIGACKTFFVEISSTDNLKFVNFIKCKKLMRKKG